MSKEFGLKFGSLGLTATTGLAPTFINFVRLDTGTTLTPPGITQIVSGIGMYKFSYTPSFPIYFEVDGATTSLGAARYIVGVIDRYSQLDDLLAQQGSTLSAIGMSNISLGTTNIALGTSNVALGTSNIALGTTNVALGTTILATEIAYGTTLVAIGTSLIAISVTYSAIGASIAAIGTSLSAATGTFIAIGTTLLASNTDILSRIGQTNSSFGDTLVDAGTLYGYLKRLQELQEGNSTYTKATGQWLIYSRGSSTLLRSKTLTETSTEVDKT